MNEDRYDVTLRDRRLPLLRDGWFLAAFTLFLLLLTAFTWQHNIFGMALSPLSFILVAWWRRDLEKLAGWARKVRSAVRGG